MTRGTDVLAGLEASRGWREEFYKHLHAHPELSSHEVQTAADVSSRLESFGYDVQAVGGGVVGVLTNGPGQTVLVRADMDALPVTELTDLPYASAVTAVDESGATVGVSHACGHDVHVVALLGASELLADARSAWSGTFIALFQPAEETAAGAQAMIDDGLTTTVPRPDVVFGQHVLDLDAGAVATGAGAVLSAGDSIQITVFGKGSHGSMPHLSVDPVVLAASIVLRLQTIVSREIRPGEFAVVTVGSSTAGSKSNIIPDRAVLLVNVRTYDLKVRDQVCASIERIVRAECDASGSPEAPTFEYYDQYPLTDNDSGVTEKVSEVFRDHFGQDRVGQLGRVTASEDFSRLPDAFGAPYSYWGLGGFTPGQERYPNPSPRFAPAIQPTLDTGTEAVVVAVLSYLGKREDP